MKWLYLFEVPGVVKFIGIKSKIVLPEAGGKDEWEVIIEWVQNFSFQTWFEDVTGITTKAVGHHETQVSEVRLLLSKYSCPISLHGRNIFPNPLVLGRAVWLVYWNNNGGDMSRTWNVLAWFDLASCTSVFFHKKNMPQLVEGVGKQVNSAHS